MTKRVIISTVAVAVLAALAVGGFALLHKSTVPPVAVVMDHTKLEQAEQRYMSDRGVAVDVSCYADAVRANGAGTYVCRGSQGDDVIVVHVLVDDTGRWVSTGAIMG